MKTELRRYGDQGEDAATRYLEGIGYKLLYRNWTYLHHEIDIIMQDGNTIVFVEVKTRHTDEFENPLEAIDDEKLWNMLEGWKGYRRQYSCYDMDFRIDAVAILGNEDNFQIEHYINPFQRRIMNKDPWRAHARSLSSGKPYYTRRNRRP